MEIRQAGTRIIWVFNVPATEGTHRYRRASKSLPMGWGWWGSQEIYGRGYWDLGVGGTF